MPDRKPNGHVRKSAKTHRRRAQYFADLERRAAGDPAALLRVSCERLLSAARNTTRPGREIGRLTDQVLEQARLNAQRAGMRSASVDHNEAAVRDAVTANQRLSAALRWLRVAVAELPDDVRGAAYDGYTRQLRDAATRLLLTR